MSIKDDVMEVSENNVTIAENLEKVYNAGMRAGLAQDPDYSEGYDDGYGQGLSDSSGVMWEDLLSGKVPVGKAKEADHADKATNAENAENAKNANHAKSADNATNANRATEANHAAEADHSVEADHATEADHSVEADHATNADKANTAVSADHATTATAATNATNAAHANNAAQAAKANYATNAPLIERGSYVGTGEVAKSEHCILTFDRPVEMLIIMPSNTRYAPAETNGEGGFTSYHECPLFLFGTKYQPIAYRSTNNDAVRLIVERFDNVVEWYEIGASYGTMHEYQRNEAGVTYDYIVFFKGVYNNENS